MLQATCVGQSWTDADIVPPEDVPFYCKALEWVSEKLGPAGLSKPFCKRLALIVCGLVSSERATIGQLSAAIEGLAVSPAKGESIACRLQRTLRDARLDPSVLPPLFGPLLPELLRAQLLAHEANRASGPHHERFIGVVIVLDESSQEDGVHLLVAGMPVGGIVLPLGVRISQQNAPMPQGQYWIEVMGLLQQVHGMLPPQLRDHVLLVADRAYGVPRMLDILAALGWKWLLRVQGQTLVQLRDGTCRRLRDLVPRPGMHWSGGSSSALGEEELEGQPAGVFKGAGWRRSQVVAVWAKGQAEPWLLLTSLPAKLEVVAQYAQRWAMERLFLSWKSHGWDIERSGIRDAKRLGRLLVAMAIATLWRLAMALPVALGHLADLAGRSGKGVRQLRLPGFSAPARPWAARFSLFSWGARVARTAPLATRTPALCWHLPLWEGRSWTEVCLHTYLTAHRQFSLSP